MKPTVPEGATVKFRHIRNSSDEFLDPRGGETECWLTLADGTVITGSARCSSKDNYSKRLGREISLGRALASFRHQEAA